MPQKARYRLTTAGAGSILALLLPALLTAATVGEISFPNSGAAEAQEDFLRGVALLHNFEYDDAAEAFRAAQEIDPDFAMAFWGEAMTHNHPLWEQQDNEAAQEVLRRLGDTAEERLAKAGSEREKDYLRALHVLYGDAAGTAADKEARDDAYERAMERLHERYPDDPDAAAFYALSILGTSHEGRDFATYMRAAAVAEEVFRDQPQHPGAAHYAIHSYDDSVHAPLGLRAARVYAKIAPDAAHAQHMTSHIFVAMGMWDDVVTANENAVRVVNQQRAEESKGPRRCGHYPSWLHYGVLQQGRLDYAEKLLRACYEEALEEQASGEEPSPGRSSLAAFTDMRSRFVIDGEAWDSDVLGWDLDLGENMLPGRLAMAYADAYAAVRRGDETALQAARERLEVVGRALESEDLESEGKTMRRLMQAQAKLWRDEIAALAAQRQGKHEDAVAMLEEAVALEESLPLFFGPPEVVKPTHELLGEARLASGDAAGAVEAFEAALARNPRRVAALEGLAVAAEAMGDAERAAAARHEIDAIRGRAGQPGAAPTAGR